MNQEKTIADLFELSIKVEKMAVAIYRQMAAMFADKKPVADFFASLANDELVHVALLRESLEGLREQQLHVSAPQEMIQKIIILNKKMSVINYDEIRNLDDAYELAHEIEHSEINAIFLYLTIESVPMERRKALYNKIIDEHLNKLSAFSGNYGDREWRKTVIPVP